MGTGMFSKLALATVAATGLYAPAMGLPLPLNTCLRTAGVANAAPSPTCASDLRECLRVSARTGLYGVRYVTAEDVARCMEAFNACISGGASRSGNANPPKSTSQRAGNEATLPQRFGINGQYEAFDCSVNGTAVSCTITTHSSTASADSWTGTITGTVSGLSLTGTMTIDQRVEADGCVMEDHGSGPVTAAFDTSGSVALHEGPIQWQRKPVSCANSEPWTQPGYDATGTWTAIQ